MLSSLENARWLLYRRAARMIFTVRCDGASVMYDSLKNVPQMEPVPIASEEIPTARGA
jgi:hypothetical protein